MGLLRETGLYKKAKCNICHSFISFKTITGNLKIHLRNRHIEAYGSVVNEQLANKNRIRSTFQSISQQPTRELQNLMPVPTIQSVAGTSSDKNTANL